MKRLLLPAGVAGMTAWTGLGALGWARLARAATAPPAEDRAALAALEDELAALHADVRALAQGFGTSFQALHDELAACIDEGVAVATVPRGRCRGAARPAQALLGLMEKDPRGLVESAFLRLAGAEGSLVLERAEVR